MWKFLSRIGKILPIILLVSGTAGAQVTNVVNAASLVSNTSLAPGSIVTIFGTHLANDVAVTTNPTNPPISLLGDNVSVGGAQARLFFVSPSQINAALSPATPLGPQTLTVTSPAGTFSASVLIDNSAPPGIFSLFGTGTHDGAILNAVTFALGAFSVTTGNGPTFLAIFATGLNLSTKPVVTIGGVPVTVQFFGPAPCCMGMEQINVLLPESLAGAGRVEVAVQSGDQTSNVVEIVLLPKPGQSQFEEGPENQTRSRELAGIAYVPGTRLALLADENDDVVRVLDISQRKVTNVIALPDGSEPVAVAVSAAGTLAAVAERGRGKLAILDLSSFVAAAEVSVGSGPLDVAIAGNSAVVVNGDSDSVSIVDLVARTASAPIPVGSGPKGVAVDAGKMLAYVTNENSGTISVIDVAAMKFVSPIMLGANIRPAAIALIPGSNLAVVTVPSSNQNGEALLLDVHTGDFTRISVNPDSSGGSSDIAVNGTTVYFADQTGGSVSVVPISLATSQPSAPASMIKVDLGARALAIDTKDNFLLVSDEGSGDIVLVDLASGKVAGRIDGVRSDMEGDDGGDDHSDHDRAKNLPVISSVAPAAVKATSTFTLTINGSNLAGARDVIFVNPANLHGKGKGKGDSPISARDSAFVAGSISVNSTGTQLTATIQVNAAAVGARVVIVETPNGDSSPMLTAADTLTVTP